MNFSTISNSFSPFAERKVCLLDERVKQLENENEQLRMKMGVNDRSALRSIKANKSNLNLELMNLKSIKLEPAPVDVTVDKVDLTTVKTEFICDDEPMQAVQNLVVLTSDQSKFKFDDEYDEDDE